MARGDQIYGMRPLLGLDSLYEHHGIDCGDGTVIHYSKAGEQPQVTRTPVAAFARGKPVYVKRQPVSYVPDVVVARAESRLGESQYDLMSNNCEHFATWCKTGRNESEQLKQYGLGMGTVSLPTSRQLMSEATQSSDPVQALVEFRRAIENVAIAHRQLQTQMIENQSEADRWHRVAELALKQGKEAVARAALQRKVEAKRKVADYQAQIDQLTELASDLQQSSATVQQRTDLTLI